MPCSEGDAVRQPAEPAGLGHRPHGRAALRAAGGAAGPGKLGGQEVRPPFVRGRSGSLRDRSGPPRDRSGPPRVRSGPLGPKRRGRSSQLCKPLVSRCPSLSAAIPHPKDNALVPVPCGIMAEQ